MGCGKSSIGRRLSELLCCRFMDLDEEIEKKEGRSIAEIFAADGEEAFRDIEEDSLSIILSGEQRCLGRSLRSPHHCASLVVPPLTCSGWHGPRTPHAPRTSTILSLGGGTIMRKGCAEMVRERTLCIYLKASVDTLVKNLEGETDGRPMLASERPLRERIAELMSLRSSTYESTAHIIIYTDGKDIEEIVAIIMAAIPCRQ